MGAHRLGAAAAALACALAAAWLAAHHPSWPAAALLLAAALALLEYRRPGRWLFALPAGLPWLDFSPWTGWTTFQEFDVLVLALLAGAYARRATRQDTDAPATPRDPAMTWTWGLFVALGAVALAVGLHDAGGWRFSWFQGYTDPLNAVRSAKSTLWALLLLPLAEAELRGDAARAVARLCKGMVVGVAVVTLAVLAERAAYPGLGDLAAPYRTTALFWEMHVGGGAIDVYLALGAPFVAWALWSTRSPARWCGAAVLALAVGYACLTTFSRGVYLAVVAPLPLLGFLLLGDADRRRRWRRAALVAAALAGIAIVLLCVVLAFGFAGVAWLLPVATVGLLVAKALRPRTLRWRTVGAWLLTLALMAEAAAVLALSAFMNQRLAAAQDDFFHRGEHWLHGVQLLHTPADWLFGIGLGRLPAHYAAAVPSEGFPGAAQVDRAAEGGPILRLSGPQMPMWIGGLYGLAQRVPPAATYRARLQVRAARPAQLYLRVCERHLLYDGRCQLGVAHVAPGRWATLHVALHGPPLTPVDGARWRSALFEISVLEPAGAVELRAIEVTDASGASLLANGDFREDLAHWLPMAQRYFLPWHIDNVYLEVLIERGLPGALAFGALIGLAIRRAGVAARRWPEAAFLTAALCGAALAGLVNSVFDVPRVALLWQLMLLVCLRSVSAQRRSPPPTARPDTPTCGV